jgi:hypothetical protein
LLELKATGLAALMLTTSLTLVACGNEGADSSESGNADEMQTSEARDASQVTERQETDFATGATTNGVYPVGEPRHDLERFFGVYGNTDKPSRDFFVAEAELPEDSELDVPPGYLMIGAMWGDAAPWYMKSLSDTEFEQQWVSDFQSEPLTVRFELGENKNAIALTFKTMFTDRGRLQRLNDLPVEWR